MPAELSDVCNWLKTKSVAIPVGNEWLSSCVEYFRSENPSCDANDIRNFVYDQWLLADLIDVKAGCFPSDCASAPKVVLRGKYAVQVNYVVNVAESFYKQMQNIRRPETMKNLEVDCDRAEIQATQQQQSQQPKAKRSLKIELTDGVVTIIAFEYEPIHKLVEPIAPGIKVLIVGPVECYKGVILLKSSNIEILGGEVDTLLVPNAVENVLARALRLEENPEPYKSLMPSSDNNVDDDDDEAFAIIADEIESSVSQRTTQQSASHYSAAPTPSNYVIDEDEFELIAAETASLAERAVSRPKTKTATPKAKNQPTLDSFLVSPSTSSSANRPSKLRAQLQESYSSANCGNLPKRNETPIGQNSFNIVRNASTYIVNPEPSYFEACTAESEWRPTLNARSNAALPEPLLSDNEMVVDYLDDEALVASVMECEAEFTQRSERNQPTSNLELEAPFPPKTFPSRRTVMASVVRIPQKLRGRDGRWCMSAVVQAKGVELEVDFSPDALDKIIGLKLADLLASKNEFRSNPEKKEKANHSLKAAQARMTNLRSKMIFQFSSIIAKPVIVDVIDE